MRALRCVIHLHSHHSDGTGSVDDIARAASRAGVDVVLLTDHDTLAARDLGEDGERHGVLVITGHEVSPSGGNHLLAFGLDEVVDHDGLDAAGIAQAVRDRGGFGIAAHPWSSGNPRMAQMRGMPWGDLDCVDAVELWSIVTDSIEGVRAVPEAVRFITAPDTWLDHPPDGRLAAYDALTARRRVVAIGGLDAHQVGIRVRGRVPVRVMSYEQSFGLLRTHVLIGPDVLVSETAVLDALRAGRCYLARDSLAPARGFAFDALGRAEKVAGHTGDELAHADVDTLRVRVPRVALVTLRRDGAPVASAWTTELRYRPEQPGAHRVEALLFHDRRPRTWIVSNPVYLR